MSERYWAVSELLARYAHVVDNKEWDELPTVFTADAEIDAEFVDGEFATARGLEEIRGFLGSFDPLRSHHTLNTIVETDPSSVVHAWSRFLIVEFDATSLTGDYVDDIVETDDGVRIAKRRISTRNRPDEGTERRQESFGTWRAGR